MDPTPRNRERTRRPLLSILICGADECRLETDPTGLVMSVLARDLIRTMPPRMDMHSTISGQAGAIMYASHDVCLLTR